jgi:hypothetical protein
MVVVQNLKKKRPREKKKQQNKNRPAQSKSRRRSHDGRQFTYDIQTCSVVKGERYIYVNVSQLYYIDRLV